MRIGGRPLHHDSKKQVPIASSENYGANPASGGIPQSGLVQLALHVIKRLNRPGFTQQTGGLTRGTTLRTTQPAERKSPDRWLADFVGRLRRDDLAPATVRGYRYDLEQFLRWFSQAKGSASRLEKLAILDLINYRQHLVNVEALKSATVNRRLKALRRFCRWAQQNRLLKTMSRWSSNWCERRAVPGRWG